MLDDEFVVLVVDGDGAEALHRALAKQERGLLALYHGGVHMQDGQQDGHQDGQGSFHFA